MRASIYSLIRLKAAVSLSFLEFDQPTTEVIIYLTLEKLLSLYTNGLITPLQYHKHIHELLTKVRSSVLPHSAAKSLTLLMLSYSSKVMTAQVSNIPGSTLKPPGPGNKSILKTLSCLIGEPGANEASRILDMFYATL